MSVFHAQRGACKHRGGTGATCLCGQRAGSLACVDAFAEYPSVVAATYQQHRNGVCVGLSLSQTALECPAGCDAGAGDGELQGAYIGDRASDAMCLQYGVLSALLATSKGVKLTDCSSRFALASRLT